MNRRGFVALALGTLILAGCAVVEPENSSVVREGDVVRGTGTVKRFEIEGGFFAIAGDDGVTYDPINLAESFRVDGTRVRFRAHVRDDMGSFHMVGPMVELLEIVRT